MGDRGNICMEEMEGGKIFFYTHWKGSAIEEITRIALKRGHDRWNDEACLARIIFDQLTEGIKMEETGFGISTYEGDKNHDTVFVNIKDQTVTIGGKSYTFADFVKQ